MLAADEIAIAPGAFVMIHEPWSLALGTADDLRGSADLLDKVGLAIAADYVRRTGKPQDEVLALMKAETWFEAEEAIAAGLADRKAEAPAIGNAFNLAAYRNPPAALAHRPPDTFAAAAAEHGRYAARLASTSAPPDPSNPRSHPREPPTRAALSFSEPTMTQSIQALREERTAKAREARALLDAKTGKDWTPEVKGQVDAIYAAIDRLDEQIARVERVLTIEDSLEQRGRVLSEKNGRSVDENAATIRAEKAIFSAWARGGAEALTDDQRAHVKARRDEAQRIYGAQSVGTGAAGGYLVPRDFAETMLERMAAFGGMRAVATVIQTDGGNAIDYATVDETGQEGEIVGESLAASGQDIAFGTVSIGAYKYSSKTVVVPLELLQDSRIDIEPYINVALATRIARITNRHFTTGTGAGQPRGVVTAAAAGKTGRRASSRRSPTTTWSTSSTRSIRPTGPPAAGCSTTRR